MKHRETVFQTEWFSVEKETVDQSNKSRPYYRINSPDGVLVLALTEKEELILVRQFRPALNQYTLEFPSGSIDRHESPRDAAARELREETAYVCNTLHELGAGRIMMNRNTAREFMFFGSGAVKAPRVKTKEDIEVILVTQAEFKTLVLSGRFEQVAGFALLVLADWKVGSHFVGRSSPGHPA